MIDGDEGRHGGDGSLWWRESWAFEFGSADGRDGGYCCLTMLPEQRRAWYWAALIRASHPLLHVSELDAAMPRQGLEVRASGLWADHICEDPFRQWTVANECYAVALDDPEDALGRAYGGQEPIAFDLELYWEGEPSPVVDGYASVGHVLGVIELSGGAWSLEMAARFEHRWGPVQFRCDTPVAGRSAPMAVTTPEGPGILRRVLDGAGHWSEWLER